MKQKIIYTQSLKSIVVGLTAITALVGFSNAASAQNNVVPVEGARYSVASTLLDNVKILNGKKITVILKSGNSITGYVKAVGVHLLHLEKVASRDFFDALIKIDDISAIESRFRTLKR